MSFISRFIYGSLLFLLGQILVWYQINGQFLSEWIKERPWLMSLCGIPISYCYIWATHHLVIAFDLSKISFWLNSLISELLSFI